MDIRFSASIHYKEQLNALFGHDLYKICIPYDLFYKNELSVDDIDRIHHENGSKVYLILPGILRKRDDEYLESLKDFLLLGKADGCLTKNLETMVFLESLEEDLKVQYISINGKVPDYTPLYLDSDHDMYCFNRSSLSFYREHFDNVCAPLELSVHELKELNDTDLSIVIYGRARLMITANCVKKTGGLCKSGKDSCNSRFELMDRKNKAVPVFVNCIHCYNEIYNSVPTSLHKYMSDLIKSGFYDFRIDLTDESNEVISDLLEYYIEDFRSGRFPVDDYTAAHISKGVL